MKRVLITGITGFVGSHMARFLLERFSDIQIFASRRWRSREDTIDDIDGKFSNNKIEYAEVDLLDANRVTEWVRKASPDTVFHFAAQSFPGASFLIPSVTLYNNIIGSVNLFEAIRQARDGGRCDPRIVNVSSSEVYGLPSADEIPMKETLPFRAANPYSISKVGQDLMGQFYCQAYQLKVITTRMFSHEGKFRDKRFALSSFAYQIVRGEKSYKEGTPVEIRVGNLSSIRTYAHILDAINAYYLAAIRGRVGEVYNIGGNHTCSVGDALEVLMENSSLPRSAFRIVVDFRRIRLTDITLQVPDCHKFKSHCGWEPTHTLLDIVNDLLNYWRERL